MINDEIRVEYMVRERKRDENDRGVRAKLIEGPVARNVTADMLQLHEVEGQQRDSGPHYGP
jgi:hypothetical protein